MAKHAGASIHDCTTRSDRQADIRIGAEAYRAIPCHWVLHTGGEEDTVTRLDVSFDRCPHDATDILHVPAIAMVCMLDQESDACIMYYAFPIDR